MLIIIFYTAAAAKLIVSIICAQLKPHRLPAGAMRLRTRDNEFELPTIKYEFNKRSKFYRSIAF